MYIITKQVKYGNKKIEFLEQECESFDEAKCIYANHINKLTDYTDLFDNEGHIAKLKRFLFKYCNANDFSVSFYESIHNYIHNTNLETIKPISIPDDYLYEPGCEDENDDFMDDEGSLHAELYGRNTKYLKAVDNECLRYGPCACDGYYIYELVRTSDNELYAYMCPTDHEKEIYLTTGSIECNSFVMNDSKKTYFIRLEEMSNNEANFPIHKEGPCYIEIKLEYVLVVHSSLSDDELDNKINNWKK